MREMLFVKDHDTINNLFLVFKRNNEDEETRFNFFRSLNRLAFDVAINLYPSKHDRCENQTDLFILMRGFAESYNGTEFLADVLDYISRDYSRNTYFN